MGVEEVAKIIWAIADGIEESCAECLSNNSGIVVLAVTEQLYSGQDGDAQYLSPTYDEDPYFNEPGPWYQDAEGYKEWKFNITPPVISSMLGLGPRPEDVPNLYINGKFFSEINATRKDLGLLIDPGSGDGPAIVEKYGDQILEMGPTAVSYFNEEYMLPHIEKFFITCGYK